MGQILVTSFMYGPWFFLGRQSEREWKWTFGRNNCLERWRSFWGGNGGPSQTSQLVCWIFWQGKILFFCLILHYFDAKKRETSKINAKNMRKLHFLSFRSNIDSKSSNDTYLNIIKILFLLLFFHFPAFVYKAGVFTYFFRT